MEVITMDLMQLLLSEMEREAVTTKKMLERIPDDQLDYKPHEKSMAMRYLATHIAEIPTWVPMILNTEELDFKENEYVPKEIKNNADLMKLFEDSLASGKEALKKAEISQLEDHWTMRDGDNIFFKDTKYEMIRHTYCQIVHHRAQLGVYLRLLNVPIPGSYGPSADEPS
ncbi:DinB family protein [Fulvivirga ligni]|uniref:DinB family protein n=1 Tax=Fulvivirga ligni TaxID=2904246 RepID=UPI001F352817|nr:DinB family protein [Fulvivirga ligni]UII21285.1 DinB family protein [Fulvivirga ligni]